MLQSCLTSLYTDYDFTTGWKISGLIERLTTKVSHWQSKRSWLSFEIYRIVGTRLSLTNARPSPALVLIPPLDILEISCTIKISKTNYANI